MIKKKASLETKVIILGTILITAGFISNFYFSNLENDMQLENLKGNNDIPKCSYNQQVNCQNFNTQLNDLLNLSKGREDPFKPLLRDIEVNVGNSNMPESGMFPDNMHAMSLSGLNNLQYIFKQENESNDSLFKNTVMDIGELQGIIGEGKNKQAVILTEGKCDFYKVGSVVNGSRIIEITDNSVKLKNPLGIVQEIEISYKGSNTLKKKGDNLIQPNVNYMLRQANQDINEQEFDNNF